MYAAISNEATSAVSFYRNKQSLFPSGQVSRNLLHSKLLQTEIDLNFESSWGGKDFTLQADQVLRDIQVARYVETLRESSLYNSDRTDSMVLRQLPPKTSLEVIAMGDYWAQVKIKNGSLAGWVPIFSLQSAYDDVGILTNLIITPLRKEPKTSSQILVTLPRLKRLIPIEFVPGFVKIKYDGIIGYIDTAHVVSRADFANLAYHPTKKWITVLYRKGDSIVTTKGESIPVKHLLAFVTNSHRGIIKKITSQGPPLRAQVEIKQENAYIWGLSEINGHGEVWWKMKDLLFQEIKAKSSLTISTETLLKREIYSISFQSKNSLKGIVSSNGIYKTDDGQVWTLIPQFGQKNHPVSINSSGTWFVGSFKSTNEGKTFEPFIRWDKIAKAIENTYHRNPRFMMITQIDTLPDSKIVVHVYTGAGKVKLTGQLDSNNWDVVKF
jgi:hypothetical protein